MNYQNHNPVIILIAGKSGSGKTTIANYLKKLFEEEGKKVILSPYTKYLKKYIEEITGEAISEENKPQLNTSAIESFGTPTWTPANDPNNTALPSGITFYNTTAESGLKIHKNVTGTDTDNIEFVFDIYLWREYDGPEYEAYTDNFHTI